MALQKGFLQSKILATIPIYRYAVGIILGLLTAFCLYSLQYMTRETIRWYSIFNGDLWILSDAEVTFYNLIFAFISIILGQSIGFAYWFDRPAKIFKLQAGRLRSIVHDQRFLNWYFLCWFSKVATMYGFLFAMTGLGGYYLISLYPSFNYVFVLIIITMFFQVWNTLLLTFRRKAYKWMMISLVVVSSLSYGLSKINIVDYRTLNESVLNNRLDVRYHLRLPESNIYNKSGHRFSHLPSIALVTPKNNKAKEQNELLYIGKTQYDSVSLIEEIRKIKSKFPQELQWGMPMYLMIDENISMKSINRLTKSLAIADIEFLRYIVIPKKLEFDPKYYILHQRTYLPTANHAYFLFDNDKKLERIKSYTNTIKIDVSTKGYKINGTMVTLKQFPAILQNKIMDNLDYSIIMNYNKNLTFGSYIEALIAVHETVFNLRDQASLIAYGIKFKTLAQQYRRDKLSKIIEKYPLRYIEIWNGSGNGL